MYLLQVNQCNLQFRLYCIQISPVKIYICSHWPFLSILKWANCCLLKHNSKVIMTQLNFFNCKNQCSDGRTINTCTIDAQSRASSTNTAIKDGRLLRFLCCVHIEILNILILVWFTTKFLLKWTSWLCNSLMMSPKSRDVLTVCLPPSL